MASGSADSHRTTEAALPLVRLEWITKIYGRRSVLEEVSLEVDFGTVTALIGRNGSGKSTLLSILAGLIQSSSGRITRSSPDMVIGYVPETFPALKFSPEQYLHSMGRISGLAPATIESRMSELLAAFHMEKFRTHSMLSFSKGMLQKINLIQSLLVQPELLLLDEPMSGLDLPAMHTLVDLLLEQKQKGTAIVFSVHEPQWIEILADRVHVLQTGKTVKMISGLESLKAKPSTYIICTEVSAEEKEYLVSVPGFISFTRDEESSINGVIELAVETEFTDDFLRYLLSKGGSIRSVETRGGFDELELWMNPSDQTGEADG